MDNLYPIDIIVGLIEEWGQKTTMHGEQKVVRLEALTNFGQAAAPWP
jgi:hypothetical protein